MRKTALALVLAASWLAPEAALAQGSSVNLTDFDVKIRAGVHLTADRKISDTWGLAGWVGLDKATFGVNEDGRLRTQGEARELLLVGGVRRKSETWWAEFMGGAYVIDGEAKPVVDVRANYGALSCGSPATVFDCPVNFFANYRLTFPYEEARMPNRYYLFTDAPIRNRHGHYIFAEGDVMLCDWIAVGAEIEGDIYLEPKEYVYLDRFRKSVWGVGPHVTFPLGRTKTTIAYQLVQNAPNWLRIGFEVEF